MINEEDNCMLGKILESKEVNKVVFNLNGDRSCGPDGLSGKFFQTSWGIVRLDIIRLVQNFFNSNSLPKSITHANLVLIPKKENIQSFLDIILTSLSNFVNKILSRITHDRVKGLLPFIIFYNTLGFVKGRSIIENVLLAQEMGTDIGKWEKPDNVIIKLNMAKAYDRVS